MSFAPVVIAPTYNNAGTLVEILARVQALGLELIVVNDGSTDATGQILADWCRAATGKVTVLTHENNRGKAAALQTGFSAALAAGRTHAATIDTDGQLDPEQIPALLAVAEQTPQALVVGTRDDAAVDYPARSRLGRRLSNLLILLESGLRVQDSQCGLRVYPLGLLRAVRCRAGHFSFETEIIARCGWAGCAVIDFPVNCRYMPPGQRVSHFRPWLDTLRGLRLHLWLLGRAMIPWPHPRWPQQPPSPLASRQTVWRQMLRWISPGEAWRQLRQDRAGATTLAVGLAVGVFIANLPFYGLQTLLSLYTARRLHLHPLAVVAGSQISTPPIGWGMIAAATCCGHVILHGSWLPLPRFQPSFAALRALAPSLLLDWVVGSGIVGLIMAALVFLLAMILFRRLAPRQMSCQDQAAA